MTCDPGSLIASLVAAGVAIAVAIGFIVAAAIANNSFFGAAGSPALMVGAGVSSGVATGLLGLAKSAADAYFQCAGSPPACLGAYDNLIAALAAMITVMGIQTTACFVVAGIAWIPWAGGAPMYVILGALIIQAALIPTIIAFANALISCISSLPMGGTGTSGSPLTATGIVVVTVIVVGVVIATTRGVVTIPKKLRPVAEAA